MIKLAKFFNYNEKEMLVTYLSDKILYEIGNDQYAKEALKLAEEKPDLKLIYERHQV